MKFKYAIKGILRNKILSVLLVTQLTFTFYALYNVIDIKSKVNSESKRITNLFEDKKMYSFDIDGQFDDVLDNKKYPKVSEEKVGQVFQMLEDSSTFDYIYNVYFPLSVETFQGFEGFKYYEPLNKLLGKDFFQAKTIVVNSKTFEQYKINLDKGRVFNNEEFNRTYGDTNALPVIVGFNYSKYFNIGDEFTYYRNKLGDAKAKVIGIMSKDQYLPNDITGDIKNKYADLNNYIITSPACFDNNSILYLTMFSGSYMFYNRDTTEKSRTDTNLEIKKMFFDKLGINMTFTDLDKYIKLEIGSFNYQLKVVGITAITVLLFVIITILISTINSIVKRKKEFGIHIFSGGTLKDISVIMYLENLLIILFSLVICVIIVIYEKRTVNILYILLLIVNTLIVSFITISIPTSKLLRLKINEIIKGAE